MENLDWILENLSIRQIVNKKVFTTIEIRGLLKIYVIIYLPYFLAISSLKLFLSLEKIFHRI